MVGITDRPATHGSFYPHRPVMGGVLHSTQTEGDISTFGSLGGWHFTVERDGGVYSDVSLDWAAWGVAAFGSLPLLNRNRPAWLVPCPDRLTSDVNYCTVQIEFVSGPHEQERGPAYTDAQYETGASLLHYLEALYGPLPWVDHGWLQTDRSDPVGMEHTRLGLGSLVAGQGRFLVASATDEEMDALQAQIDQLTGVNKTLGEQLAYKDQLLQEANTRAGVAEQEVATLQVSLDTAHNQIAQGLDQLEQLRHTAADPQALAQRLTAFFLKALTS